MSRETVVEQETARAPNRELSGFTISSNWPIRCTRRIGPSAPSRVYLPPTTPTVVSKSTNRCCGPAFAPTLSPTPTAGETVRAATLGRHARSYSTKKEPKSHAHEREEAVLLKKVDRLRRK